VSEGRMELGLRHWECGVGVSSSLRTYKIIAEWVTGLLCWKNHDCKLHFLMVLGW
jgi:hypothetical protein